jgi:hypothetical protein
MTRRVPKERLSNDKAAPHSRLSSRATNHNGERRVLHQKIALCVSVLALSLTTSASVSAQPAPPPYYPGPVPAQPLPPHEILTSVRSTGLEPLSRPMRFGPAYSLRAADAAGRELRVIADARTGRVLKVTPVLFPRYAAPVPPPPAYGGQPGRITAVPDGYGPNSRIATLPPGAEGRPPNVPAAGGLPSVPAPTAALPRPTAQASPPPLPRPRPKLAAAEPTVTTPVTGAAPQAAPPQVEAKESNKEPKESETTGATPAAAPSVAPPSAPVEE